VEALNLPRGEQDNHKTLLINYLRNKHLLLVLDGFEHLLDGAGLLPEFLRGAPMVKILVTSRVRLNIKSEHLYLLSGMSYPEGTTSEDEILGSDAVQLLLTRLRQSRPGYDPPTDDCDFLLRICQQVQGMPLGIILAASWGVSLSVEEIAERISRSLDFLAVDWDDVPPRQRSLRATFDHTWNLLGEGERRVFQGLSVFRGAFTRKAAREVSEASSHDLSALAERSLVWNKTPGWYEVHELLRQYGREKLAQSVQVEKVVCDRHSVHYLNQLERLGDELKSVQQESALSSINLEHENYRAAWNWSASHGDIAQIARGLDPICHYYDLTLRYKEGENACRMALEGLSQNPDNANMWLLQARTFTWKSRFTRLTGNLDKAAQHLEAAHTLLGDAQTMFGKTLALPEKPRESGDSAREVEAFLAFECGAHYYQKDRAVAADYFQDSLKHYQELDQPWWVVQVILQIALCAEQRGDFKAAEKWLECCLKDLLVHCDRRSWAVALRSKAFLHIRQGEVDQAMKVMKEAVDVFYAIGDPLTIADGSIALGMILGWHGRYQEAIGYFLQSLPIYQDLGYRYQIAFMNAFLGIMYALKGLSSDAKHWANKSLSQARKYKFRRLTAASLLVLGWMSLGEGEYGQAAEFLQESVDEYRQVKNKDELGWALAALGHAQLVKGETREGLESIQESLQVGSEIRAVQSISQALGPSALWIGKQGDPIKAVELYRLACQDPAMGNSGWFGKVYGGPITALAEELPKEIVQAAEERGRSLDLWKTAADLLDTIKKNK
jgi:predicted ATPase